MGEAELAGNALAGSGQRSLNPAIPSGPLPSRGPQFPVKWWDSHPATRPFLWSEVMKDAKGLVKVNQGRTDVSGRGPGKNERDNLIEGAVSLLGLQTRACF